MLFGIGYHQNGGKRSGRELKLYAKGALNHKGLDSLSKKSFQALRFGWFYIFASGKHLISPQLSSQGSQTRDK